MLLDSNIIIYAHKPEYQNIRDFLKNKQVTVSAISYIEALGYPLITAEKKENVVRRCGYRRDRVDLSQNVSDTKCRRF